MKNEETSVGNDSYESILNGREGKEGKIWLMRKRGPGRRIYNCNKQPFPPPYAPYSHKPLSGRG